MLFSRWGLRTFCFVLFVCLFVFQLEFKDLWFCVFIFEVLHVRLWLGGVICYRSGDVFTCFFCCCLFVCLFSFCFVLSFFFFLFDYFILLSGRVVLSALGRPMCLVGK